MLYLPPADPRENPNNRPSVYTALLLIYLCQPKIMDHLTFHEIGVLLKDLKIRKYIKKESIDETLYQSLKSEFTKRLDALPHCEVVSRSDIDGATQTRCDIKQL